MSSNSGSANIPPFPLSPCFGLLTARHISAVAVWQSVDLDRRRSPGWDRLHDSGQKMVAVAGPWSDRLWKSPYQAMSSLPQRHADQSGSPHLRGTSQSDGL